MPALTPVRLQPDDLLSLHAAHPKRYPVLLQSAARGEPLGCYDILLALPGEYIELHADGKTRGSAGVDSAQSFLSALDSWWLRERVAPEPSASPFTGGWFLFLGYELAQQIEPKLRLPSTGTIAQAIRFRSAIVIRHSDGAAWIVEEDPKNECAKEILADMGNLRAPPTISHPIENLVEEGAEDYIERVSAALRYIARGDVYQANLSRAWRGTLAPGVKPLDVYRDLRRANPAPFAALAVLDDVAILSSSPERLIAVRGGVLSTRPIAGTRPRNTDRSDDIVRSQELLSHPKERAEHVMLIDLERNDLGRVCLPGSVEVDEFMTVESYAHVHHIVSNVRGRLRPGVTPGQIIAAVFPGGTITGCPKVRCMEIVAELEGEPRGAYTGSIGYLNRDGSMDSNILIRSIEVRGRQLSFRAGAGIVADSLPERELEETRAKARGLIEALTG